MRTIILQVGTYYNTHCPETTQVNCSIGSSEIHIKSGPNLTKSTVYNLHTPKKSYLNPGSDARSTTGKPGLQKQLISYGTLLKLHLNTKEQLTSTS